MNKITHFLLIAVFAICGLAFAGCSGSGSNSGNRAQDKVSTPQFSPTEGTYSSDQNVTITCATASATIYYTTDGSTPSGSSTAYTAPIAVSGDGTVMTIKTFAVKSGMTDSDAASATFTIDYSQVSTPQFNPPEGTHTGNQSVTITCPTSGAEIRYTTDGSNPGKTSGAVYTAPVEVSSDLTLKAIAYKSGMADSTIAEAVYTFAAPGAPEISGIISGCFIKEQTFSVTGRPDAAIEYSIDEGNTWAAYSSPVTISADGSYKVTARQTANGKTSQSSPMIDLVIDSAAPNPPVISGISSGTFSATQYFTLTGTEINIEYSLNGGATWLEYTGQVTLNNEQTYTVTARQTDFVGNISATATPVIITIDWPPVPIGGGTLTVLNVQDHSYWIGWAQASDTKTPQSQLQYKIVRSTSNNIGTVIAAETTGSGRTVVKDWTNDLCWTGSTNKTTSWELVGLNNNATYYYTVLVKDESDNKVAYTSNSQATLPNTHSTLPFTNGPVKAMVSNGTNLYIGGSFTSIGGTLNGAAIDGTGSGSLAASVVQPVINGEMKAVIPDGSGGWYVGGSFTSINGVTRNYLARINSDGSLHAWNPNADGSVCALAINGSTIYAGGYFTSIGGTTRNYLAAIGTDGTLSSWDPNANTVVNALVISGNTVFIGGNFTTIGGTTRNCLAAIDTDGTLLPWDPNAGSGNIVCALAISGNTVYIGGSFGHMNGEWKWYLAAVDDTNGTMLPSWPQYAPGNAVKTLAISGDTVYIGGQFTSIAGVGTTRNRLAAMDCTDGSLSSWNPNANGTVNALAISGNTVYIGGNFTSIGGTARNGLAAVGTNGTLLSWDPNAIQAPSANSDVNALAINGSVIYAGGNFSIGGSARNGLAAISADGTVLSWNPNANNTVYALAMSGSLVYAGGAFTSIGGTTRNRLAVIHTSGNLQSWDPNADGTVYALAIRGSIVYAGGEFTSIGGTARNYLAAINGAVGMNAGTLSEGWKTFADAPVYAIATSSVAVYVGGDFTQIDEGSGSGFQTRNYLASIDHDGGLNALNLYPDNTVTALAIMETEEGSLLYIGGYFSHIDGTARNRLGAIDIDDNSLSSWNPDANDSVNSLAISGDGETIYIGGYFTSIGETTRNRLAAIGSDGTLPTWNPNLSGDRVNALAIIGSTVYAGGDFSAIGGLPRKNLSAIDMTTGLPW